MAYEKNSIVEDLKHNVLEVVFEKVDGSIRRMKCTLDRSIIPADAKEVVDTKEVNWKELTSEKVFKKCGDDPGLWAAAFKATYPDSDEGIMHGWFANVIEAGIQARKKQEASTVIRVYELDVGWRAFDINRLHNAQIASL